MHKLLELSPVISWRHSLGFPEMFVEIRYARKSALFGYLMNLVLCFPQEVAGFIQSYGIQVFIKSCATVLFEVSAEGKRTHVGYS